MYFLIRRPVFMEDEGRYTLDAAFTDLEQAEAKRKWLIGKGIGFVETFIIAKEIKRKE